jgi:hypothetical protein
MKLTLLDLHALHRFAVRLRMFFPIANCQRNLVVAGGGLVKRKISSGWISSILAVFTLALLTAHASIAATPQLAAGQLSSFVVEPDGSLWAWGANGSGQLGDGTTTDSTAPKKIGDGYKSVSAGGATAWGGARTFAFKIDGSLWAWGAGPLGDGTNVGSLVPIKIGDGYTTVSAGFSHVLALKSDGSLWVWGSNIYGQLGDGTTKEFPYISVTIPKQIGTGFTAISAGYSHSVALKSDGSLWAWGMPYFGSLGHELSPSSLGDGTTQPSLSPKQIGTNFSAISAGIGHTAAIKSDGTLWTWGKNTSGELGDGTTTDSLIPKQIGSGYKTVFAIGEMTYCGQGCYRGTSATVSLKLDGSLWVWGANNSPQRFLAVEKSLFPKQIGSTYTSISAGSLHGLASKADGSVWEWSDTAASPSQVGIGLSVAGSSLITFPIQNVGSTSSTKTISLINNSGLPITITGITTVGDYAVSHNCGTGLGAGSFCTLNIAFNPSLAGARDGTVTIISDVGYSSSPLTLNLSGVGQGGTVSLSASTLTFPSVNVGALSSGQTLTLSNTGGLPLNVSGITISGDFSQTTTCGTSVAAGGNCSIIVSFMPTAAGTRSGTLTVAQDAGNPITVTLTGGGVTIPISPAALTFPAQGVGTSSAVQAVTFSNTASASVSISVIQTSGDFTQTNNCGAGLGVGGSCTVGVTFTPTVAGSRTGSLTITSSAIGSPHVVALTGEGGSAATTTTTSTSTSTTTPGTTTTTTVATTTTTTLPSSTITITVQPGWNLIGNAVDQILSVVSMFGDPVAVTTVWKWDIANAGWQFYAPSMDAAALQTYSSSKGYGVLSDINPGEGFWVNSNVKFSVNLPIGIPIAPISFQDGKSGALKPGWNLIGIGNIRTPSGFNADLSAFPPAASVIPLNLTSLWAWDNPLGKWYFYAPNLESLGGTALTDYITSKGYLDFTANAKKLEAGVGFWVNKPQ